MTFQIVVGLFAAAGVFLLITGVFGSKTASDKSTLEQISDEALEELTQDKPIKPKSAKGNILKSLGGIANPFVRGKRREKLQATLSRAGVSLLAQEFVVVQIGIGTLVGTLAMLRFGTILMFIIGGAIGYFGPSFYIKRKVTKRKRMFESQLGDSILVLSNGVKAGYSIQQALAGVSENAQQPMAEELNRVVRETALGIDTDVALNHANERLDSKDFDLMVTAILIHRSVGGNLAEVLDKISETIRERVKLQGEIGVLTAQARASGYIVTGLPFGVGALLSVISPGFETPLFKHPLGWALIGVGLISISIGYFIISKITNIKL
jgi:tight adherence protein B